MHVRILGSAAGGGVPQWNCNCSNCAAARAGSMTVRPRTQSSVAVSADGRVWFLLNVSPDIRQQILSFPTLGPPEGAPRGTAIAGCVLTDAELDHTAGLLLLREGGPLRIHCTTTVRRWLNRFLLVEPILACFCRPTWHDFVSDTAVDLLLPDGTLSGLRIRAFEVDRHVPRFVTGEGSSAAGAVSGLEAEDTRTSARLIYVPCLGSWSPALERLCQGADCLLIDGTFWDDAEPFCFGIGKRKARAMGHLPVSGMEGSLSWLGGLNVRHRVYVHINNTNPMLNEDGPEYRQVTERGVRIGMDGDSFEL
jgi:pyrroloquinoline quinone biosynthesis protein B